MAEVVYKFVLPPPAGGIPGLPHKVTKSEAKRLGVLDILEAAIANKSYKPEKKQKIKKSTKNIMDEEKTIQKE